MGTHPTTPRIHGLDILRAWAIILVLITHSMGILAPWAPWVDHFTVCGVIGVELFFVLSGFLIGKILLRVFNTPRPPSWAEIRQFWIRRWFRTLPNYLLVLLAIILLTRALGHHQPDWRFFLFMQNLASPHPFVFGEAWSLAVEEWFYLTTPLLFHLTARLFPSAAPKARTLYAILSIIALGLLLRIARTAGAPVEWDSEIRKIVLFRPDAIMFGVFWAWVKTWHPAFMARHARALAVAGLALGCGCSIYFIDMYAGARPEASFFAQTFFFSLTSLGLSLLLPLCSLIPDPGTLVARFTTLISRMSYSMYLTHFSIILTLCNRFFSPASLGQAVGLYAAYWALCLVLPYPLHRWYELPAMNLRDRFPDTAQNASREAASEKPLQQTQKNGARCTRA